MLKVADAKTIGERLVKLRGKKTKRTVQMETGLKYSRLAMYETGKRIPSDDAKAVLARYYGMTIDELFYTEE